MRLALMSLWSKPLELGNPSLDIMKIVDTTALVLTPNSGDVLQIFKAGIMEIADLFIINKADLPGVGKLRALLRELVHITKSAEHQTPIVKTITTENQGIDTLWEKLKEHHDYLYRTTEGEKRREERHQLEVLELIRDEIWRDVYQFVQVQPEFNRKLVNSDPYKQAMDWYYKWKKEGR